MIVQKQKELRVHHAVGVDVADECAL
jgi:hypothetical protein